jgi:hypothetical protein
MYQFFTSSKDATIYEQQPNQNTGLDELIEVSANYILGNKNVSRGLIQFNSNSISSSIASGEITMTSAELVLRECESEEIPTNYSLYMYQLAESWDMGIGTKFDDISTQGVTWDDKTTNTSWTSGSGGYYVTASAVSESVEYLAYDITFNVVEPINSWVSGSIDNNGWVIKFSDSNENDTIDYGMLQFFGKETNTIYQPKIRIGWDDSQFVIGSLPELIAEDIKVTFKRLKTKYKEGSTVLIRLVAREKYPLKTYTSQYSYNDVAYLPSTTYYQIKDAVTHEVIVPFSDFSKVSCDDSGNYFRLNLKNWETNRDYYIEIKTDRNGEVEYFSDDDIIFTVEKN